MDLLWQALWAFPLALVLVTLVVTEGAIVQVIWRWARGQPQSKNVQVMSWLLREVWKIQ